MKLTTAAEKGEEPTTVDGFDDEVGPENFHVIAKLGQGSFGIVYLVEHLRIGVNAAGEPEKVPTGDQYAMKILNKK